MVDIISIGVAILLVIAFEKMSVKDAVYVLLAIILLIGALAF